MPTGEIRVDPGFIDDLESRYRGIAGELREVKSAPASLHQAPPVQSAFEDFQGRWDWTRGKLADAADGLADAIRTVGAAFTEADTKMAATLDAS
jgi:uncharacterized protein YukE